MPDVIWVSLTLEETMDIIDEGVLSGTLTGKLLDSYVLQAGAGRCVVNVYQQFYSRAGGKLTLTVTADDFEGTTRVHAVSGGGESPYTSFNWGATEVYENRVMNALLEYQVRR